MKSHIDLNVWKCSTKLAVDIYQLTKQFPKEEVFGITNQVRRAAVSVPSNISEGAARGSKKDFIHFLNISAGSLSELETQLFISKEIGYCNEESWLKIKGEINKIRAQISGLKKHLQSTPPD
jgi:four helix bundle protein